MEKLNSSQRAYLRGLANRLDAIFQLGKEGISDNFISQIDDVLEKRELIKISLLETCEHTVKEAAQMICDATGAQSVQMIGRKIVFYREARKDENRKIELPVKKK
ncbi:MAG: ribosome assembly RNA-binding protein YhbY [Clostridia bacterium]|nr:ribosome assembly RNA-binding protein YhbY [Clostridia bacterium]